MLEYPDFYNIAAYGNENWKGSYTEKEIACNAYDYYSDFKTSKEKHYATELIQRLLIRLLDDGSEECMHWYMCIIKEIRGD